MTQTFNESYTMDQTLAVLQKSWHAEKPQRLLLQGFLDEEVYARIVRRAAQEKGTSTKIADRFSYSLLKGNKEIIEIFSSKEFKSFLSRALGKKVSRVYYEIRRYGWKDYTLLHDSEQAKKEMEFFFFMPSLANWDYFWGGNKIYQTEGGEGKPLVFIPTPNTLGIVRTDKETLGFTQYLNHYVGQEQLIVVEGRIS